MAPFMAAGHYPASGVPFPNSFREAVQAKSHSRLIKPGY
jgi:hypothetical protein